MRRDLLACDLAVGVDERLGVMIAALSASAGEDAGVKRGEICSATAGGAGFI